MKKLLFTGLLLLIIIAFAETLLRCTGLVKPGMFMQYSQFETVDSLYGYRNYTTDETGIYKFSSGLSDSVHLHFDKTNNDLQASFNNQKFSGKVHWQVDNIGEVISDFHNLVQLNFTPSQSLSEFEIFAKTILENSEHDDSDSLLIEYFHHPVNRDGFRSVSFSQSPQNKKKVLLVGDSFTYGLTAKPIYNSFADVLLARGYWVYNTGISGTDPAQYLAVAQKYIPLLNPDIVIVNICTYNDIVAYAREVEFNKPPEYLTNAGFFQSSIKGNFYSMNDAYEFYQSLVTIPTNSFFNKLMSKSAISTLVWRMLHKIKLVQHNTFDEYMSNAEESSETQIETTLTYLNKIKEVGAVYGVPIVISFLPDKGMFTEVEEEFIPMDDERVLYLMDKTGNHYPSNFLISDFAEGNDAHFNNQGHSKYASYLEQITLEILNSRN
jgi:hypothetical protein